MRAVLIKVPARRKVPAKLTGCAGADLDALPDYVIAAEAIAADNRNGCLWHGYLLPVEGCGRWMMLAAEFCLRVLSTWTIATIDGIPV